MHDDPLTLTWNDGSQVLGPAAAVEAHLLSERRVDTGSTESYRSGSFSGFNAVAQSARPTAYVIAIQDDLNPLNIQLVAILILPHHHRRTSNLYSPQWAQVGWHSYHGPSLGTLKKVKTGTSSQSQ